MPPKPLSTTWICGSSCCGSRKCCRGLYVCPYSHGTQARMICLSITQGFFPSALSYVSWPLRALGMGCLALGAISIAKGCCPTLSQPIQVQSLGESTHNRVVRLHASGHEAWKGWRVQQGRTRRKRTAWQQVEQAALSSHPKRRASTVHTRGPISQEPTSSLFSFLQKCMAVSLVHFCRRGCLFPRPTSLSRSTCNTGECCTVLVHPLIKLARSQDLYLVRI